MIMTCTQKLAEKIPNENLHLVGFSDRSARATVAQVRADTVAAEGMSISFVSHARPQIPLSSPHRVQTICAFTIDTAHLTKAS
jgi:hypothetical protein